MCVPVCEWLSVFPHHCSLVCLNQKNRVSSQQELWLKTHIHVCLHRHTYIQYTLSEMTVKMRLFFASKCHCADIIPLNPKIKVSSSKLFGFTENRDTRQELTISICGQNASMEATEQPWEVWSASIHLTTMYGGQLKPLILLASEISWSMIILYIHYYKCIIMSEWFNSNIRLSCWNLCLYSVFRVEIHQKSTQRPK